MTELSAALVCFNVLKNRDSISYKELKEIRDKVQAKYRYVYLHICREDIHDVLVGNQNIFCDIDNLYICKLGLYSAQHFEKQRALYDSDIPEDVREDILKMLSE